MPENGYDDNAFLAAIARLEYAVHDVADAGADRPTILETVNNTLDEAGVE